MAKDTGRNWCTIIYQDSVRDDYLEIISSYHCECFVSPWHDSDLWTKHDENENPLHICGTPKKVHRHILFMFEGNKTQATMQNLIASFGGVGCKKVESLRGYARYLCHLDEFDKPHYDVEQVLELAGADYSKIITSAKDRYTCFREMIAYVYENDIRYFNKLMEYAMSSKPEWFKVLCDGGSFTMRTFVQDYNKSLLTR